MAGPGSILLTLAQAGSASGEARSSQPLTPGQTVRAVVTSQSGDQVALRVAGQVIEARLAALLSTSTTTQLTPGTALRFQVEGDADGLQLRLLSQGGDAAGNRGSTSQAAIASQPASGTSGAAQVSAQGAAPNVPRASAAGSPTQTQAQAQTGSAQNSSAPPGAAQTATPRTGTAPGGSAAPAAAPQAAASAAARGASGSGNLAPTATATPTSAPPSQAGTVRAATAQSAPLQSSTTQLMTRLQQLDPAMLARVEARPATGASVAGVSGTGAWGTLSGTAAPATAGAAGAMSAGKVAGATQVRGGLDVMASRLLSLQLQPDPATSQITGAMLKEAVQRNGPFMEAMLAAGRPDAGGTAKAQLGGMIALLGQLLGGRDRSGPLPAPGSSAGGGSPPGSSGAAGSQPTQQPPPLPQPGAPPKPQASPPMPQLSPDTDPATLLQMLARDTEGALHRARLLQLASLPDADLRGTGAEKPTEWQMDIPLRHAGADATLGLTIARDGSGQSDQDRGTAGWRIRLAVDLADAGPIHAIINYHAGTIQVGIWAEDRSTADRLTRDSAALRDMLQSHEISVEEIAVEHGAPPAPAAPPAASGLLVDRTS